MRTTIDLPDPMYRQIKSRAALEGRPVKDLLQELLRRGLAAEPAAALAVPAARSKPPTVSAGRPLPPQACSNAALFELLDAAG